MKSGRKGKSTYRERFGFALLAVTAGFIFMPLRPLAAATRLSAAGVRGFPGATVSVPVKIAGLTNTAPSVVAVQVDVPFNANDLISATPSKGDGLANQIIKSSQPTNGIRRILIYSLSNAALTNGAVADMPFAVSAAARAQSYPLPLANVVLSDSSATSVASSNSAGYISISPVFPRSDGDMDVFFFSTIGKTYVIQATTNLVQWTNILTITATTDIITFTDPNAHLFQHRFYRAVPVELAAFLSDINQVPDGKVSFNLAGAQGYTYIVQASTNLADWVNISTNYLADGVIALTDHDSSKYPRRFYRAILFDAATGGRIGALIRLPDGRINFQR